VTTAKKRTTAKRTTSRATTRRSTARRTTTRRTGARRTSRTAYRRRTKPKVATTIGAALGTLVVAFLLDASWPVRIGLVALALLLVGGYLVLQGRRSGAEPAETTPTTPATTPTTSTATDSSEDPRA
jgi:hypothetical protein